MTGYAAIKLVRETIGDALASVREVPDGHARLAHAMLIFPYKEDDELFFIGGNYMRLKQPDYTLHILTRTQLNRLFTYQEPKTRYGIRGEKWFVVHPKRRERT